MTPLFNRYLVKVETNFQHEILFKSGVKLFRYVGFDPSNFATLIATVSAVPRGFKPLLGYEGITLPDIQVGDDVIVRYDAFSTTRDQPDRDSVRYENEFYWEGKSQWFVDVMQLIAVRRGNTWEMLNSHVWMDIVERKILNPLIPEQFQSKIWKGKGIVRFIGKPLEGDEELDCKAGDTVFFDARYPMVYELNNTRFYIIKQRYIHCKHEAQLER